MKWAFRACCTLAIVSAIMNGQAALTLWPLVALLQAERAEHHKRTVEFVNQTLDALISDLCKLLPPKK